MLQKIALRQRLGVTVEDQVMQLCPTKACHAFRRDSRRPHALAAGSEASRGYTPSSRQQPGDRRTGQRCELGRRNEK